MSKNTVVVAQGADVSAEALLELKTQLSAKLKDAKAAKETSEWEVAIKIRNPQYVVGSLRKGIDADEEIVGHSHGMVCKIRCVECSAERLINKQDAFQVRYCLEHKAEGRKEKAKAKREVAAKDPAKLQAQIAALQAKLAEAGVELSA